MFAFFPKISKTLLFSAAFILTRPLGAVSGDLFDMPVVLGGMAINRYMASGGLQWPLWLGILIFPQRAAVGKVHWTSEHLDQDHLDLRGWRAGGLGSQVTEAVTEAVTESGPGSQNNSPCRSSGQSF